MYSEAIKKNIQDVLDKIASACRRSGRKPEEITLMTVTKTKPREMADAAYEAGIRVFGENRVQEAEEKFTEFYDEGELHLIGHLQTNKAKQAAELFSWVQSIDKVKTAEVLATRCAALDKKMNVLLEMNTSGEESKYGYPSAEAMFRDMDEILKLKELQVRGLMTIAPFTSDEDAVRRSFRACKKQFSECVRKYPELDFDTLSMGMSGDYEIAIEEGSTMVRLGSIILGARR